MSSFGALIIDPSEPIHLDIVVANAGGASTAAGFEVDIFADLAAPPHAGDAPLLALQATSLGAGASLLLQTEIPADTFSGGAHTLWALADGRNDIAESNESNNSPNITIDFGSSTSTPTSSPSPSRSRRYG